MDLLGHARAAMRHADDMIEAGQAMRRDLEMVERLWLHAMEHWNGAMRDATRPCPPSELPDGKLGAALAKVRDFLRPAPGRPPDPLFDEVIAAVGLENAKSAIAGSSWSEPADWWMMLKSLRPNFQGADMERAE